ncbi:MAG: RnfABCDGE type electron transport complex subunit D [Clostridia bacterium]|nr:RnfABCDGE type electron transport complex subunit D [Clostridia bacterium]
MTNALHISSGPHFRDRWTTSFIMHTVLLALLPSAVVGVLVYGLHALFIILASIVSAIGSEWIFCAITKRKLSITDGSAAVTGMMLALSLSPSVPIWIPIVGSAFAIIVVKCLFGGLGKNFVNPALAARCFLLISFGNAMTVFPLAADCVTSATPVALLAQGYTVNITQMFLGTTNGVIGSSVLALLVGGLILWGLDIIHGEICFSVLAGFTVMMGLFGGQGFDPEFLLAHLCGGGVVMGAFFMATDYTTSPVSRLGQLTYGCLIGVLGALFRIFGHSADSFSYSIIIANLFTPMIDTYIIPKPYAYRKAAIKKANHVPKVPFWQQIPKPVIALTLITLLAGVALSGAFAMTKDTIEEQKLAANAESYRAVCPEAVTFEGNKDAADAIAALEGGVYGTSFGRSYIHEAVIGRDASGEICGYVISVTNGGGYEGNIKFSVGIKPDGSLASIAFTELNETPGKGSKAAEPAFIDQFKNRAVKQLALNGAGDNGIDAISGATITSSAVVNGTNAALDFFRSVMQGGN